MKKFLKNNIKLILVFLLGIVVSSGITAYAVNNYMSEQIRYQNNTFAINNVSEALDDLYSYSKEKIDNNTSNNYSTEEQVVGTWIDGKPLYQKTWTYNQSEGKITICNINDLNIDKIFLVNCYVDGNRGYSTPAVFFESYTDKFRFLVEQSSGRLLSDSGRDYSNGTVYATFQYTKTTDTATN